MKKTLFAIVSLAVFAMGCVKEQQPSETPADSKGVSTIRISMAPTKVSVDETTGACAWQDGDQIAVWFANADATAGQRVVYTFKTVLSDGSAEFETSETITEGYAPAKVTYPAECLNDQGGWGLIRDWEYKEGFIPMYARTETITVNDDGSLSAQLYHNASVFKFTLHDIPAYAAGFVLEAVKYNKNGAGEFVDADGNVIDKENATPSQTIAIKTSFPYKTGYTANPADNSNDITLYSVAAHGSYLTRVYLVDGDGDEIEGSEKRIKQSWNDVSTDDFIEFPTIDFKKADLRKDFVKVCGIKWAKGNLVYDKNNAYHSTKSGVDDNFQTGWGLHDEQYKFINYNKGKGATYDNNENWFDHFNYGGIGRNAKFWSGSMLPSKAEYLISGKVWKGFETSDLGRDPNADGTKLVELTGDDRFTAPDDAHYVKINNEQLCGDVAFWASKGKYRLPQKSEFQIISHFTSGKAAIQYGYYKEGDVTVYGILYTTPLGTRPAANKTDVEFDSADLECGLFIPKAGRRGPRIKEEVDGVSQYLKDKGNSKKIMALNQEACYISGNFGAAPTSSSHQYYSQRENPRRLHIKEDGDPVIGYTGGSQLNDIDGNYVDNTMSVRAGYSIRPVLVETAE